MAAIGPTLPPHLAKRKRSTSSSSEDEASPTPAPGLRASQPQGPSLPPSTEPSPSLQASSTGQASTKQSNPSPPRRVIGPSLPPDPLNELPHDAIPTPPVGPSAATAAADPSESSSDDDDDDYGPSLPPPAGAGPTKPTSSHPTKPTDTQLSASAKPQREEWMLAPPSGADWTSRIDPTKLRARKFQTGPKAGAQGGSKGGGGGGISGLWTETPEEKRRRLEGEVLGTEDAGKEGGEDQARAEAARRKREEQDRKTREKVEQYDAMHRGKESLVDRHGKKTKTKEDNPSKRGFDYEKDIAGGGLSSGQTRKMLGEARDMGSRFATGKFL